MMTIWSFCTFPYLEVTPCTEGDSSGGCSTCREDETIDLLAFSSQFMRGLDHILCRNQSEIICIKTWNIIEYIMYIGTCGHVDYTWDGTCNTFRTWSIWWCEINPTKLALNQNITMTFLEMLNNYIFSRYVCLQSLQNSICLIIQSSVVTAASNLSRYVIQHYDDSGITLYYIFSSEVGVSVARIWQDIGWGAL